MEPRSLHMFYEPDAEEWVIAHDEEDATAVYLATGYAPIDDGMHWEKLADDKILKMYEDEMGGPFVAKTCAEWVAEKGRSYWGSANY